MGRMITAVEATLDALDLDDAHGAAAELAKVYAGQLDSAEAAEAAADRVLRRAELEAAEPEVFEMLQTLRSKLAARTTIANIGPRLESLLGRLLATPKDAGAGSKPAAPAPANHPAPTGSLARLRAVPGGG